MKLIVIILGAVGAAVFLVCTAAAIYRRLRPGPPGPDRPRRVIPYDDYRRPSVKDYYDEGPMS